MSAAANQRSHIFVFEEMEGNRLYFIMKFQKELQAKLTMQAKPSSNQGDFNFDEMMTKLINAQEHKVGRNNVLTSLVINHDFDSSFVVTAT